MGESNKTNDVLISVIVAIYNVEPYLQRCLNGIVAQKHKKMQIVLVDDGSTDSSAIICDEYMQEDDRIEVIHKENGGLVSARKAGLAIAKGRYIGFVDGDDYIDTEFYSAMLSKIVEYDVDFVHSAVIKEYGARREYSALYDQGVYHIEGKQADFIKKYMLGNEDIYYMYYGVVFKLFKTELIKSCYAGIPDSQSIGEDMLASCRCLLSSKKVYMDKTARYHYVIRRESLCHQRSFESLSSQVKLHDNLLKVFDEYDVREQMQDKVDSFFQNWLITYLAVQSQGRYIHLYCFPYVNRIREKKIIIYGAGKVGQDYYAQLCRYRDIEVVAWADKNSKRYHFDYAEVVGGEKIVSIDTDYVLIATLRDQTANEIRQELNDMGIDGDKIIWEKPQKICF